MKKSLWIVFMLATSYLSAQDAETVKDTVSESKLEQLTKNFTLGGSVDAYFRQNLNGPNGEDAIAPRTAFANQNGFALGMVNVILSYDGAKVGAVADLVYGPRGEEAVFNSEPSNNIVNQLYVYWNVTDKLKLTFGNFNTFLGYEVISPVVNFNYSTSYMFTYGPFSHTGLKANYAFSDKFSGMVSIMNDNDLTDYNPTNDYTFGAQLGYDGTYLNFLFGPQFQIDLTTGFDLSDSFFLGLNSTYYDDDSGSFYGVALYPQWQASDDFALGLRAEYFAEEDGGVGAIGGYDSSGDGTAFEFTLTGSYQIGDLYIKPELRLDSTSEETFYDNDMDPTDSLTSFLIAAIYKF